MYVKQIFRKSMTFLLYKKSKVINITLFFTTFFIYLYFVLLFTTDLNNMEKNFNNSRYRNTFLQLIAALLFLIGTIIFLTQEILSLNDTTNPTQ